jgi:1,4-dihydroxy-2-naphthoate polyprenyltransferase
VQAMRPRTLPLAVAPIALAGGFAAYRDRFSLPVFLLCLLTALLLQILSNFANDLGDALKGTDDAERTGPKRAVASGWITVADMRRGVMVAAGLAVISGLALLAMAPVVRETWFLAAFAVAGLGAVAAAIGYTMGKRAFGYSGLGDLMVLLFFGVVGVVGSYVLIAGEVHAVALLAGVGIGLLASGVLHINNLRDQEGDARHGKRTLVVRLGDRRARVYHVVLITCGSLCLAALPLLVRAPTWWMLLPALLTVPAHKQAVEVGRTPAGPALNPYLGKLSLLTAIWGISLGLAFALS